jgi:hypothetical protein
MSITILFLAMALGADAQIHKTTIDLAVTPEKLLANIDEFFLKNEPILVRFRVGSVGVESIYDVAGKTTSKRIILYSGAYNAGKHASFDVALLPESQAALRRVGIADFSKHFAGKEVEVRGWLTSIPTMLYASPVEWAYYLDVKSLEQFRAVKEVK